jgi:hypothetical protein
MPSRLQTIGTRLSETQYEVVRLAAEKDGLSISEWLRQVVIAHTSRPDRVLETLLEQFEALRYIFLNLVVHLTTTGLIVNRESLTIICAKADAKKAETAQALLTRATALAPKET